MKSGEDYGHPNVKIEESKRKQPKAFVIPGKKSKGKTKNVEKSPLGASLKSNSQKTLIAYVTSESRKLRDKKLVSNSYKGLTKNIKSSGSSIMHNIELKQSPKKSSNTKNAINLKNHSIVTKLRSQVGRKKNKEEQIYRTEREKLCKIKSN